LIFGCGGENCTINNNMYQYELLYKAKLYFKNVCVCVFILSVLKHIRNHPTKFL